MTKSRLIALAPCILLITRVVSMVLPATVLAQQDRTPYQSVVKIICDLPGQKQMKATGFVWRDTVHVVTALHAVAGCDKVIVKSEHLDGAQSLATVEKANLEADLALLKLTRALDLVPLKHATSEPNTSDQFTTVGYPHSVNQMIDVRTEFAGGLKGGMTTLNAFNAVDGQDDLFAGVPYPKTSVSIFRVTTLLQPGQSGAPILDKSGRVVAIADGGLLDGWRGLNWSIPAHKYLPGLPDSGDEIPNKPSKWALHFSNVTTTQTKSIAIPPSAQTGGTATASELRHVRTMTLGALDALLHRKQTPDDNIKFIRESEVESSAEFDQLSFEIYEDPVTGATLGVPSGTDLAWNGDMRMLEAKSKSGAARLFIGVLTNASYAQAKVAGRQAFVSKLTPLAKWTESPAAIRFVHVDDSLEWANNAGFFSGTDSANGMPIDLLLSLSVSGTQLLGYAVYGPSDILKDLSRQDVITYLMMQMSAQHLSGFAQQ